MCHECDVLRARVADLEDELESWRGAEARVREDEAEALAMKTVKDAWGVATIQQTFLVKALYDAAGRMLSYDRLATIIARSPSAKAAVGETGPDVARVQACHARKNLPAGVRIVTVWGRGYIMPVESAAVLRALLAPPVAEAA